MYWVINYKTFIVLHNVSQIMYIVQNTSIMMLHITNDKL